MLEASGTLSVKETDKEKGTQKNDEEVTADITGDRKLTTETNISMMTEAESIPERNRSQGIETLVTEVRTLTERKTTTRDDLGTTITGPVSDSGLLSTDSGRVSGQQ
jgi:hypothetical protein